MGRLKFKEVAKGRFKTNRNVVISETYDETGKFIGYSISEQLVMQEDGKPNETKMFLKSGLGIVQESGLKELHKAITEVIGKIKK